MKHFAWLTLLLGMMVSVSVSAQEPPAGESESPQKSVEAPPSEDSPEDLYKKYRKEFSEIQQSFSRRGMKAQQEMMAAKSDEEREQAIASLAELREEMSNETDKINRKLLLLAKNATEDEAIAVRCLQFVLVNSEDETDRNEAMDLLLEDHLDSEKVVDILQSLSRGMPSRSTHDLFEKVLKEAEDEAIKARASLAYVAYLEQLIQVKPMVESDEQIAQMYPEVVTYFQSLGDDLNEDTLMEKYLAIAEEYGEVQVGSKTIADAVEQKIKVLEIRSRVAVGKVAPEIEGPDIDGTNFKLSDYRGNVVMLDFWGDW